MLWKGFSDVLEVVEESVSERVFRSEQELSPLLCERNPKCVGLYRGASYVQCTTVVQFVAALRGNALLYDV